MFSRIFFTILLIGILNEVCQSQKIVGCTKFSDSSKPSQEEKKQIVIKINSKPATDVHFIPIGFNKTTRFLKLKSCQYGTRIIDSVDRAQLKAEVEEFKKQPTSTLTLDFENSSNNCIKFEFIREQIKKILHPNATEENVFIDLARTIQITKPAIKRTSLGQFVLVDDCEKNSVEFTNTTETFDIVQQMAHDFAEALEIDFKAENCRKFDDIAKNILDKLKETYKGIGTVDSVTLKAAAVNKTDGEFLVYKKKQFGRVGACENRAIIPLELNEVNSMLFNITTPIIEEVDKAINP